MRNSILRPLSLLGISLMLAISVAAQERPKEKITDKEDKYKSTGLKAKDEKGKEIKYKGEDLKTKVKKEEDKFKTVGMKEKIENNETKIKGRVHPMHKTVKEQTEMKTGETEVTTQEHYAPVTETHVEYTPAPAVAQKVPVPQAPAPKPVAHRTTHRHVAARKNTKAPKYIVRTKLVRDTVFVPGPTQTITQTQTEYVHDTVTVTRVDTFTKMRTEDSYTGYRVPRGNFKKVKLKKDKETGEVWMKRKEDQGSKTDKIK